MKKQYWYLIGVLALAAVLRLYNFTAISLWHDEAFSALLITYPWKLMMLRIGLDVHPPLYYIILRFWADILGHSLASLRGFSVFFGVATVYATYLFTKRAFNDTRITWLATLLMALSPFQIQYVTEARMYTFGTFVLMMSAYFAVRALQTQKEGKNAWPAWIWFALFTSAAMYTHYYLMFSVAAIGLFIVGYLLKTYGNQWKEYKYFLGSYILVFILYVPWIKTFLFQFRQVQNNYWIPKMDTWSIPLTNYKILTGLGEDPARIGIRITLIIAVLFSLFMLYRVLRKSASSYKWLALSGLIIPFVGAILLSLKQSIFLDRYFLFAALFYTVLLALFVYTVRIKTLRVMLIVILLYISIFGWFKNWQDINISSKPGMDAVARYLANNVEKNDKLYVASSFEFFNYKYYNNTVYKTGHTPLLFAPGITDISQLPHFSGTALLTNQDLAGDPAAATQHGDHVWILWTTAFGGSDPHELLPKTWVKLSNGFSAQDIRPYSGTWIIADEYAVQ